MYLCIFCVVITGLILDICKVKASRSSCHNVTVNFIRPLNTVTIKGITGIPSEAQVEIRCDCLGPKREAPEWSFDDRDLPSSSRNNDDPYVDADRTQVTLKVDSFGEDSSGLYRCHSRDTTVEFNLAWYDPSK